MKFLGITGCEKALISIIETPEATTLEVSAVYGSALASAENVENKIDWNRVNSMIVARWGTTALFRIKKYAHQMRLGIARLAKGEATP